MALFKEIQAGRHIDRHPWTVFQLAQGEYNEIERQLKRDKFLFGYVKDKIRYDYFGESHRLVIRMPTGLHELFIDRVEDTIRCQLRAIGRGSGRPAIFAEKVRPARSTRIFFPVDNAPPNTKSKHEPDASFWHVSAEYPGVIIEVSCSQKRKMVSRLAEDYLLDSDTLVRVVVGLDIEYGKKDSHRATLSVWRTQVVYGHEVRVVAVIATFRDDQGNATDHAGLRLQLSDFACEELTEDVIGDQDQGVVVSAQQLCQYLAEAETMAAQELLVGKPLAPGLTKRKRSETPPEEIDPGDEM